VSSINWPAWQQLRNFAAAVLQDHGTPLLHLHSSARIFCEALTAQPSMRSADAYFKLLLHFPLRRGAYPSPLSQLTEQIRRRSRPSRAPVL
jgi:hypothetical protein